MRLEVLGSAGSWPEYGTPSSGYVVEHSDTRVVLDLGFGTVLRLSSPESVDAVVVSHRHPDHCADVLALFHLWGYGPVERLGVPLIAPVSAIEALSTFLGAAPGGRFFDVFSPEPVTDGSVRTIGSLTLRFVAVDHSVPTFGVHVEAGGRSLFYTGDTGPAGEWWTRVPPCDLVLSEATWQGDGAGGDHHLTAKEAGTIASSIGAGRLVVTHVTPGLDPVRSVAEAQTTFSGEVVHALPGLTIEV
ncbi:MAG TPA: MBL fold metallo-hydrolase [Acidimicrobiia bacterium]|nr:MBL fold metallo-hydrolase [Acidimicrobiia bacterium]